MKSELHLSHRNGELFAQVTEGNNIMKNLNPQELVILGTMLRHGLKAAAYRLVDGSAMTPSNQDNINGVSVECGATYIYGPHENGRKYWRATYN